LYLHKVIPLILVLIPLAGFVPDVCGQGRSNLQSDVRTDLASALRVIRPLLREDAQRAIQMLEKLNKEYPGHSQVLVLLGEAYRVVGDVDSAREAYETCQRFHPANLQAGTALGLLYVQGDDVAKGDAVFRDLLERTKYGVNTYRMIGSALSRNGFFAQALRYYEEGRDRNNSNYVLTLDIAYMQKSVGNLQGSLIEYLRVIETSPKQHRLVKTRIMDLLRVPDADHDELFNVLRTHGDKNTPYRRIVMEILASGYLERGMLEKALEMALLAGQQKGSDGSVLFVLAGQAVQEYQRREGLERTRYFDLGLRALEAYLDGYPDARDVPRAKLMLIDLLVDLASGRAKSHPDIDLDAVVIRALQALDWLITSFPGTDYAEQAYLKKGDVVFRIQKRPQEALKIYTDGMQNARFYPTNFAERLGRVYLVTEEYERAKEHFSQLVKSKNKELSETGVFYNGLLLTFMKQYEAARDSLTGLAESNPASQFTNDAIHLAWVIEEGLQGDQRVLDRFVKALRLEIAGDTTQAISELTGIVDSPETTPLRARSLVKLGELYESLGEHDKALAVLRKFVEQYPQDARLPDVHRKVARIHEQGYSDKRLALKTYEDILISFPHYIFLDEVRADVKRLRETLGEAP